MFIGREKELQSLNERYNSGRFEFLPVYGRRRVGKTALIREFIKGKRAIFFTAAESGKNQNLRNLSSAIYEFAEGISANLTFTGFDAAFDAVYDLSKKEKLIFIIDEYPYLAQSYKPISSILQGYIDQKYKDTDMFLILCGSSMSFMEYQVLGYKSPLYGRRTGQYKVLPFNFADSALFHNRFTKEESAVVYGITGGIPKYLEAFNDRYSLKENIIRSFLSADSMLFEEPSNILKQELREPQTYNDIITSIATGSSKMNEIVTSTRIEDFDSSRCNKYLQALISLGIVKKETPVLTDTRKKSIYRLNDGLFRFWYRFVPGNLAKIQLGLGEQVYDSIKQQLPDFMGEVYEDICKQWLWQQNIGRKLPFVFRDCGRWWGTDPANKREAEIDLLAFDDKRRAIFCECKWRNEKTGRAVLEQLIEKSKLLDFDERYYVMFSKSGFKKDLIDKAGQNVMLVDFSSMCS